MAGVEIGFLECPHHLWSDSDSSLDPIREEGFLRCLARPFATLLLVRKSHQIVRKCAHNV